MHPNTTESRAIRERTSILIYCATFLKPEMRHVYRQVNGLQRFVPQVITRRRKSSDLFPFTPVTVLKKSNLRFFRSLWYESLRRRPAPLSRYECDQMLALREKTDARIAHLYFGTEALKALPYLRRESCAKVVSFHGADIAPTVADPDFNILLAQVDAVLCRSRSLAQDLIDHGCPPEKVHLNPTGIPIPDASDRPPPPAGTPVQLLQASRFIEKKGLDISIRALALLRSSGVNARLILAGDGPLKTNLESLARELGVFPDVRFPGFLNVEALARYYRESHLFLHPSRTTPSGDREGIPNSMLEAMSYGIPPIATRHSGIPEAITDGVEGVLLPSEEPEDLAAAIRSLINDPDRYAAMSITARTQILDTFSIQKSIHKLEDVYLRAIDRAKKRNNQPAL